MTQTTLSRRPTVTLAAALLACGLAGAASAAPLTGSGVPILTEQPSLGLNYLVETAASNVDDYGQVVLFAGNFAPGGFSEANGQLLPLASNQVLFSQLGAAYGGNGTNTFALPNLAGRTVVGTGQGSGLTARSLGSVAGSPLQTLTASELPAFGGASGVTSGGTALPTLQPSIALNQTVVTQGFYPTGTGPQASGPLVGQVLTYARTTPPPGRLAANGQALSIQQNQALFSVIGTEYGGDGRVTFDLPNLNGRAATEAGAAPGLQPQSLGATAGTQSTVLSVANLPPQRLTLPNGTMAVFGANQPLSVMQPTQALHYIIATQGVFPTQSGIAPDNTPFLGEISLFAGTVAPVGWSFADGQLLSIAENQALFAIIGSTYGGNGVFDFALPNLVDRVAVGIGDGVTLGEQFGSDSDTLNFANLPVGYPAVLPTSNVPEPPAGAVLLSGIAALCWFIRRRPRCAAIRRPKTS